MRRGKTVACAKTEVANHCWVSGLQPDTEYTYKVFVKGQEWASGERWDWSAKDKALVQTGGAIRQSLSHLPDPAAPVAKLSFAVIGDFGVGVRHDRPNRRQQQVANSLRRTVDQEDVRFILTTGDNIYARRRVLGVAIGGSGDEDDDWFFTYFQPYRYVLNRIPVYPSIGNHDADETEEHDDRAQVEDNFYLRERIGSEEAAGRASFSPGLFYRFRFGSDIEFVCIDTSKESFFKGYRLLRVSEALGLRRAVVSGGRAASDMADSVRASSALQRRPAASQHPRHGGAVAAVRAAGVRVMFTGHEHNFQHSRTPLLDHFVTGAAGKMRRVDARWIRARAYGVVVYRLSLPAGADRGTADDACARSARSTTGSDAGRHRALRAGRRSGQRRRRNRAGSDYEFRCQ